MTKRVEYTDAEAEILADYWIDHLRLAMLEIGIYPEWLTNRDRMFAQLAGKLDRKPKPSSESGPSEEICGEKAWDLGSINSQERKNHV